ncbi:hypothetical protein ABJI51_03055 [Amycolatopsis sp. NEAU-NG30]|uniref:Uncharacterized protein n=1 Tax=Amycolatopsis melonis TaxID=3156488 RepID=A0ABV0L9M2_9PSEU
MQQLGGRHAVRGGRAVARRGSGLVEPVPEDVRGGSPGIGEGGDAHVDGVELRGAGQRQDGFGNFERFERAGGAGEMGGCGGFGNSHWTASISVG